MNGRLCTRQENIEEIERDPHTHTQAKTERGRDNRHKRQNGSAVRNKGIRRKKKRKAESAHEPPSPTTSEGDLAKALKVMKSRAVSPLLLLFLRCFLLLRLLPLLILILILLFLLLVFLFCFSCCCFFFLLEFLIILLYFILLLRLLFLFYLLLLSFLFYLFPSFVSSSSSSPSTSPPPPSNPPLLTSSRSFFSPLHLFSSFLLHLLPIPPLLGVCFAFLFLFFPLSFFQQIY